MNLPHASANAPPDKDGWTPVPGRNKKDDGKKTNGESGSGKEAESIETEKKLYKMHLQIDQPRPGNKSRAACVKEALMIVAATSKHIKVLPKDDDRGEILDNIDDFMTTNEFANQYLFDTKLAGKKYYRNHGLVDVYSTKIRIESDIKIHEMKFATSPEFLDALKSQQIYLREYKDGATVNTRNSGWLFGLNPNQVSHRFVTSELEHLLEPAGITVVVEKHTVRIKLGNKAYVTQVLKMRCDSDFADEARDMINTALGNGTLKHGWKGVKMLPMNLDANTTAMYVRKHNAILHDAAIITVKNVWNIQEPIKKFTKEMAEATEVFTVDDKPTIEDFIWKVSSGHGHAVRGMVVRRGSLQILTNRATLNEMYGFFKTFLAKTEEVLGTTNLAASVASYDTDNKIPYLDAAPDILLGKGKFRIDTTHFSEEDFKKFVEDEGITYPTTIPKDRKIDCSKPPTGMFYRGGREPVERDPGKLRKDAKLLWKKFTSPVIQQPTQKAQTNVTEAPSMMPSAAPTAQQRVQTATTTPMLTELEQAMKEMKASQQTVTSFQTKMKQQIQATDDRFTNAMNRIEKNMTEIQKHQIDFAKAQQQTNTAMTDLQKTLVKQQQQIETILRKVYGDQEEEQMDIDDRQLKRTQEEDTNTRRPTPTTPVRGQNQHRSPSRQLEAISLSEQSTDIHTQPSQSLIGGRQ